MITKLLLVKVIICLFPLYVKAVIVLWSAVARMRLACYGVDVGKRLKVRGWLNLHISPKARVKIGDSVTLKSGHAGNPTAAGHVTTLWAYAGAKLRIGDRAGLAGATIVCSESVQIGHDTFIGGGTEIYDTDFHPVDPAGRLRGNERAVAVAPVSIGDKCWVGTHCLILKGVSIGAQSVIGAGSVVTRNVPPRQVWAGDPASFVKPISGGSR